MHPIEMPPSHKKTPRLLQEHGVFTCEGEGLGELNDRTNNHKAN